MSRRSPCRASAALTYNAYDERARPVHMAPRACITLAIWRHLLRMCFCVGGGEGHAPMHAHIGLL